MSAAPDRLPRPTTREGDPRRVGIEVELGGITESDTAALIARELGGEAHQTAAYEWQVRGTSLGDFEVLLDTALRDHVEGRIAEIGLDLGRAVIPVEFVTPPILPERIPEVDALCTSLARSGGFGTKDGVALGFGLHLNVALPGTEIEDILPVLRAFALIEDWMRHRIGIDAARRVQPFVETYGTALLDRLCDPTTTWSVKSLMGVYLAHAGSRNHALDALPLFKRLDRDRVVAQVPEMKGKSGRPAWHYRLPDCRLDEQDWSIALEWSRWCAVERVAGDDALMQRLMQAWRDYRARPLPIPGRWRAVSAEILDDVRPLS